MFVWRAFNLRENVRSLSERARKVLASEVGHRVRSAVLLGGLASLFSRGLPIIAMMVVARVLGPGAFGKFTLLIGTALAFEVLVTSGLSVTCTKFVSECKDIDPERAGRLIDFGNVVSAIMALGISVFVIIFASWIASSVLNAPELTGLIRWSVVLIAIISSLGVQQGILLGLEAFRASAKMELCYGISMLLIVPIGALIYGYPGAFVGVIISYFGRLILLHLTVGKEAARRGIFRKWVLPRNELPLLWNFSLPAMLGSIFTAPVTWFALAIVAREPSGHDQIGIFNATNQWFSLLLFVPTTLNTVMFPLLTEKINAGAISTAQKLFYLKIVGSLLLSGLAAAVVALMSNRIIQLYGPMFSESGTVLVVVALAAWIASPLTPIGNLLIGYGYVWTWFFTGLVWASALLVVVFLLRDWGALALAFGFASAYASRLLVSLMVVVMLRHARAARGRV